MGSKQINLSGFNLGESNVSTGVRIAGKLREIAIKINTQEKLERDDRLDKYFKSISDKGI